MPDNPVIFWFRRDLRLADNPALLAALAHSNGAVGAVFIVDPSLCASAGPTRLAYLRSSLSALDASIGGNLIVRDGDPSEQLASVARELGARHVVATADFAPHGRRRDEGVAANLGAAGIATSFLDSPYVVAPGTVTTKGGTPCRVFGAFRRGWEALVELDVQAAPRGVDWLEASSVSLDLLTTTGSVARPSYFADLPDGPATYSFEAGEAAAHRRLASFERRVERYAEDRNLPGVDGTSRLSADLRFGALHPRQVLARTTDLSSGGEVFRSEICWREFYADVLFHHPESVHQVLQPSMSYLRVDRDERAVERFRAWALGETGYPLVDAGMRQLLDEGWMHNRVRMVCASFLVKHLHLDWRWGAAWFMWRLVDGDVASNQHGWQWVAGTGTDAAPFHRIFNPTLQGERFDAQGVYVRRYVEGLRDVSAPGCLQPGGGTGLLAPPGYVAPIVDANTERLEALARFSEARELAKVRT